MGIRAKVTEIIQKEMNTLEKKIIKHIDKTAKANRKLMLEETKRMYEAIEEIVAKKISEKMS